MIELNQIIHSDSLTVLKTLPNELVNCCVTSPPYWGLRDYGIEGQIGLEKTPEEYVGKLVEIFREVQRVLKNDGTLWLNLGDSYYGGGWKGSKTDLEGTKQGTNKGTLAGKNMQKDPFHPVIKSKDLVGIPWHVAFALQADGWHLRQDIIWSKLNSMPESVTDRCTKSHEYVFLLSKSPRYYFDNEAIKETASYDGRKATRMKGSMKYTDGFTPVSNAQTIHARGHARWQQDEEGNMIRNKRSVWEVPNHPFKGAHFATFPEKLIIPMIKAGCPEGGIVLDPFMGAGTTALVALKLDRKYIGIELNQKYINIANKRIAYLKEQGKLFESLEQKNT